MKRKNSLGRTWDCSAFSRGSQAEPRQAGGLPAFQAMRESLLPEERLIAIMEELAGFVLKEMVDDNGLFSINSRYE